MYLNLLFYPFRLSTLKHQHTAPRLRILILSHSNHINDNPAKSILTVSIKSKGKATVLYLSIHIPCFFLYFRIYQLQAKISLCLINIYGKIKIAKRCEKISFALSHRSFHTHTHIHTISTSRMLENKWENVWKCDDSNLHINMRVCRVCVYTADRIIGVIIMKIFCHVYVYTALTAKKINKFFLKKKKLCLFNQIKLRL